MCIMYVTSHIMLLAFFLEFPSLYLEPTISIFHMLLVLNYLLFTDYYLDPFLQEVFRTWPLFWENTGFWKLWSWKTHSIDLTSLLK